MLPIHRNSVSKFVFALLLSCLCLTGGICDPTAPPEDSLCGASTSWSSTWTLKNGNPNVRWIFGMDNGKRTVIYFDSTSAKDICPDEHARVQYSVIASHPDKVKDIKAVGEAHWSLFGRFTNLELTGGGHFGGVEEIGLKQAFDAKPGYLFLQIKFIFPSLGGVEQDSAFIVDAIEDILIDLTYKKAK